VPLFPTPILLECRQARGSCAIHWLNFRSHSRTFQQGEESQYKRRRLNSLPSSINPATLEQLFIRWISRCSIGFRMAERSEFRDLLFFLNPRINI
jgi:hypothetical protein